MVVTGQVKLYVISSAGHEKVIELIAPGHTFAEALMFTGKPYIVNAQALSDAKVLTVKKAAVLDEIADIKAAAAAGTLEGRPAWPAIVLRSPKGWTCPKIIDGLPVEGT